MVTIHRLNRVTKLCCIFLIPHFALGIDIDIADIIDKYDLKRNSQLKIQTINIANTIEISGISHSLDHAVPYPIFTTEATHMFDGKYQALPKSRLLYKEIGDEVVLISKAKDGTTDGVSIYSETGELRLKYEKVDKNQFVPISSASVDYESMNKKFRYGEHDPGRNSFRDKISPHESASGKNFVACTTFRVIELAVVYESSFCSAYGSKDASEQMVIEVVAGVSLKYQQEGLCIKVKISHMEGYCTPGTDPYKEFVDLNQSGCGTTGLLQGFQDYWNAERSTIHRDDAQLFSGTGLECFENGLCVIGCAALGSLCDSSSYGVNWVSFSSNSNSQQVLVAHELGHNCGANHINTEKYIMYPSVNAASLGFSSTSINSFENQFSRSSCIELENTDPTSTPTIAPTASSKPSTASSPFIRQTAGTDSCPPGYSPIYDVPTCVKASEYLGITNDPGANGDDDPGTPAVCFVTFVDPSTGDLTAFSKSQVNSNHLRRSAWICKSAATESPTLIPTPKPTNIRLGRCIKRVSDRRNKQKAKVERLHKVAMKACKDAGNRAAVILCRAKQRNRLRRQYDIIGKQMRSGLRQCKRNFPA
eukprot:CAMPEP_0194319288 /NCGR_PEP_ID=MMETSP0171-20130528/15752_1 /TAXON_ID=218684 /ORGANISM="Corethron pennatum, Strain L29A3" /LENGTH=590 /DNA_ID=CAMNT_0039076451 /DNA_START=184 /DNA_END=1956 /DNA_ORIENTATION=+